VLTRTGEEKKKIEKNGGLAYGDFSLCVENIFRKKYGGGGVVILAYLYLLALLVVESGGFLRKWYYTLEKRTGVKK
jgi:hypothetical protein